MWRSTTQREENLGEEDKPQLPGREGCQDDSSWIYPQKWRRDEHLKEDEKDLFEKLGKILFKLYLLN